MKSRRWPQPRSTPWGTGKCWKREKEQLNKPEKPKKEKPEPEKK